MVQISNLRTDGYVNTVLGLGTATDKSKLTTYDSASRSVDELDAIYNGDALAQKIVNDFARTVFKEGFEVECEDEGVRDLIYEFLNTANLESKLSEAIIFDRKDGAGAILPVFEDMQDLQQPLDLMRLGEFKHLTIIPGSDITPDGKITDILDINFGKPARYKVRGGDSDVLIDRSRLILLRENVIVAGRNVDAQKPWGKGALEKSYDALLSYANVWNVVDHLISDISQSILKMKGLWDKVSSSPTAKEQMETMTLLMQRMRSVTNTLLLDSEDDFERKTTDISALPEIITKCEMRLSAYSNMPATFLMGRSPEGMNATGESDITIFYDRIDAYIDTVLIPAMYQIIDMYLHSKKVKDVEQIKYEIVFNSRDRLSEKEKAELRNTKINGDVSLINSEVVPPELIAKSRMRPGGYDQELNISWEDIYQFFSDRFNIEQGGDDAGVPTVSE